MQRVFKENGTWTIMPVCFLHWIQQKIETKYHEQKARQLLQWKKATILNDRMRQTGPAALEIYIGKASLHFHISVTHSILFCDQR